ncbi:C40 family peptidase [Fodinicola feengrottensis]|uniref:C40 family peptidase n=1 Tax=Fodinicola feengrottensis TaxID=435914 RepID=UPI0013D3A3F1|nr:C40 family peptidase [Fodinicola feengrottensis]
MSGLDTFLALAASEVGKPYVFGGATGPNTFDCSGLVQFALSAVGIKAPRLALDQEHWTTPVTNPQPGDLVFWGNGDHESAHVAIYVGGGKVISAPQPGENVKIQNVWQGDASQPGPRYGRVPGLGAATAGLVGSVQGAAGNLASSVSSSFVGPLLDGLKGIVMPLGFAGIGIALVVAGGFLVARPQIKKQTDQLTEALT